MGNYVTRLSIRLRFISSPAAHEPDVAPSAGRTHTHTHTHAHTQRESETGEHLRSAQRDYYFGGRSRSERLWQQRVQTWGGAGFMFYGCLDPGCSFPPQHGDTSPRAAGFHSLSLSEHLLSLSFHVFLSKVHKLVVSLETEHHGLSADLEWFFLFFLLHRIVVLRRSRGWSSGCIEVYALCVKAAFSLLPTRGRLLWLYRSLCFMW